MNAIVVPSQQGFECIAIAARGAVDELAIGVEDHARPSVAGARGEASSSAALSTAPSAIDELLVPFKG